MNETCFAIVAKREGLYIKCKSQLVSFDIIAMYVLTYIETACPLDCQYKTLHEKMKGLMLLLLIHTLILWREHNNPNEKQSLTPSLEFFVEKDKPFTSVATVCVNKYLT